MSAEESRPLSLAEDAAGRDRDARSGEQSRTLRQRVRRALKPIAKRVLYSTVPAKGPLRPLFRLAGESGFYMREAFEWVRRAAVATPTFLALCESHGENISVDRVPYINGVPRIQLGSNIRFSGQLNILAPAVDGGTLRIADGVFIGHDTCFAVAQGVSVGRFASVGSGCFISDTEGHSHYNPEKPIWEVPATPADIAPVVIEDGAQIGKQCIILKGVTVGARSVVGSGSVVRSDVPADSVVMGNPARVVKRLKK